MKRMLMLGLALALLASLFVGCASNNAAESEAPEKAAEGNAAAEAPAGEAKEEAPAGGSPDDGSETMNITLMLPQYAEVGPSNDSPVVQQLNEKLNIKLDIQWVPGANYNDKISVLAASNSLPDVYRIRPDDFLLWRDKGVFMDVKPYLSLYPNLSSQLPELAYQQLNPKGHYYGLPYYGIPHLFSLAIRQDWLERVNLEMPNTIDEFYEVAKAFATQDPDGNGKHDTTGFSVLINPNGTFGNAAFFQGAFGLGNEWAERNGELIPMQAQTEELKAFIGFLRKAYAEGVLDKDFLVMKSTDARNKFWSGQSGIQQVNPNEVLRLDTANIQKNFPDAKIAQLLPPEGPTGIRATHTEPMGQVKVVINSKIDEKKQHRILKLLDYMVSEEGYDLIKNGVEGVDYKKNENGGYEKLETKEAGHLFSVNFFRQADNGVQLRKYNDPEYKTQVEQWFANNDQYDWPNPAYGLPGETEALTKYNFGTLNTKWMSTMARVISGELPPEAIDDAVAEWKKNGGDELIKEVNALYQERK